MSLPNLSRREILGSSLAACATAVFNPFSQADDFSAGPPRYPDSRIITHDSRFGGLVLGNTAVQRLHTHPDTQWVEGPAWNAVGKYLLWSDIPNNLQNRWLNDDSHVSTFRSPSNNSNGNTFDWQGRQISCEHLTRSVVRYEHDGTRTVLASDFNGKSLNAPNDAVVHPNGDIWFTDPGYGSLMDFEGRKAQTGSVQPYQKEAVYRIHAGSGKLFQVTTEVFKPNGLCFSPDYKKLYVADTGSSHYPEAKKEIKVFDVVDERTLNKGRSFASMVLQVEGGNTLNGQADGIRCDVEGNVWAAGGWGGEGFDGVHVFAGEDGKRIGQILLPEICSNLCFGGPKKNRLFMTASKSIYAVYTNTRGAHLT